MTAASLNPPPPPTVRPGDRLGLTLVVAIAIHATVILGIGFQQLREPPQPETPTLEITLVQTRTKEAPEKAEYLAQASNLGSGQSKQHDRPTAPAHGALPKPRPQAAAPSAAAPAPPRPEARTVTTRLPSRERVTSAPPQPERPVQPLPTAGQLITSSLDAASLTAELDQAREAYAQRERVRTVSASTQETRFALYLDAWRRKVEQIGNLNYPDEAKRQHISGSLRLLVRLERDGSVRDIELRRSSGHKVLDDAAMRIVRLAAPFAPLPESITRDTDVLEIVRTWVFRSDNRLTSTSD